MLNLSAGFTDIREQQSWEIIYSTEDVISTTCMNDHQVYVTCQAFCLRSLLMYQNIYYDTQKLSCHDFTKWYAGTSTICQPCTLRLTVVRAGNVDWVGWERLKVGLTSGPCWFLFTVTQTVGSTTPCKRTTSSCSRECIVRVSYVESTPYSIPGLSS